MKSISPGTVTIGVIAIVLGLVAAYAVRRSLEPEAAKPAAARKLAEGVPLVIAKQNIPRHHRITAADLEVRKIPADKLPEGSIQNPAILIDRIAKQSIEAGERVVEDQVYDVGEKPGISHKLEPGFRALPIGISGSNMSATFLHVGDLVDVHLTFEDPHPMIGGLATKTLLKNVRVIAKGMPSAGRGGRESTSANQVTLAVNEDQANMLITAQKSGTLSVTLCGDRETASTNSHVEDQMLTRSQLFGLAPIQTYTVQSWKGGKMEAVVLSQDLIRESREATAADQLRRHHQILPVGSEGPIVDGIPQGVDHLVGPGR